MIRNTSYSKKQVTEEINHAVGKPYNLIQRIRLKGIGSPRMKILEASPELSRYLARIETGEFCNIELRPNGIIVQFRHYLNTMAWIIPFHQLSITKADENFSIYGEEEFLKVGNVYRDSHIHKFFAKLLTLKANQYS